MDRPNPSKYQRPILSPKTNNDDDTDDDETVTNNNKNCCRTNANKIDRLMKKKKT